MPIEQKKKSKSPIRTRSPNKQSDRHAHERLIKQPEKETSSNIVSKNFDFGIFYKENFAETIGVTVDSLDLSFEEKCLYSDLEITIGLGDKLTIVGENGCGKTTFLKLLCGAEEYSYSGNVEVTGRIGYLPQNFENVDGDDLAIITLLKALFDPEINEFLKQAMEPFSPEWLQDVNTLGGHEIFKQANALGLAYELLQKPFKLLSGGEKTKIMLCALSILEVDILLLDEPTNCLDSQGINWLENYLKNFDGALIMVTHDRSLINAVSNRISELNTYTKKFTHFRGGYKNYLEEEEKRRKLLIEERNHQEKELKKLKQQTSAAKGKVKSRIIRSGSDRDKISYNNKEARAQKTSNHAFKQLSDKVEQLSDNLVDVIPERSQITFDFEDNPAFSATLLNLAVKNVTKSFSCNQLFTDISFELFKGDRLIIQGPNGSGKSTLMKIIMNIVKPDSGTVEISGNAKIGYLDQEQESLPLDISPIELLKQDPIINATDKEAIKTLRNFGLFTWHDLHSPMKTLSIGCRRKAQLCQIIMRGCSIILLDEPTNHIDFPSLEAIEDALLTFPGIIISATHDRYFTEKVGTQLLNICDPDKLSQLQSA